MALGLPDHPPEGLKFEDSLDDESCPVCGWDREDAATDPQAAHNAGMLVAVEREQSPFTSMQAAVLLAWYWRCPNLLNSRVEDLDNPGPRGKEKIRRPCHTLFTTEEEVTNMGGMS